MYFLQLLVAGLQQGGIIALLSMGLALMFGTLRVVNFAQADFMMLGMYGAVLLYNLVRVGFAGASVRLMVPAFAAGLLVYRFVIRQVAKAKLTAAPEHAQLLATLGLSLVIQNGAEMVWGSTPRTLGSSLELSVWRVGGLTVDQPRTVALGVAVLIGATMLFVLRHTHLGRCVRAAASDAEAAGYAGVNVAQARACTFAVAIVLSVVVGAVLVTYYPVTPVVGNDFILLMFTAVVLGGLGNVVGAMLAGLLLGLVQSLSQAVVPLELNSAVVFGLFLLVMLLRPSGIFGEVTRL